MPLNGLHHFTLRPADLEATRVFYVNLLGLRVGERPPLPFPGYWLYTGDQAVLHLIGPRERDAVLPPREPGPTGLLDHIAFSCTGLVQMRERLAARNTAFEERIIPRDGQIQLFMRDPNGVMVELFYAIEEAAAAAS